MRHISRINHSGLTFIEVLVSTAILVVLMSGFLLVITAGEKSRSMSAAQMDVQAQARRAVDWIARDVRQARRVDIGSGSNSPSASHIEFRMVSGYDTSGMGSVVLSPKTIRYTYDSLSQSIVRVEITPAADPAQQPQRFVWTIPYIVAPPFYTKVKNENGTYSIVPLDPSADGADSPILQSGNLVIQIVGQKKIKNGLTPPYVLRKEVRIRN